MIVKDDGQWTDGDGTRVDLDDWARDASVVRVLIADDDDDDDADDEDDDDADDAVVMDEDDDYVACDFALPEHRRALRKVMDEADDGTMAIVVEGAP